MRAGDGVKEAPPQSPEPGRDDRDPHLAGEPLVVDRAEDDVRVVRRRLADHLGRLVDLEQGQVLPARDREQDPARTDDLGVDQRRAQGALGGLAGAALAGASE